MSASTTIRRPALVALVAVSAMLGACSPFASPSDSAAPSASSTPCGPDQIEASGIDGMVVDSDGNPLEDIFIQIDAGTGFRGSARTSDDGVFLAPGVSGEFVITTVDIDYASVAQRVTVPCGETVDVEIVLTARDG